MKHTSVLPVDSVEGNFINVEFGIIFHSSGFPVGHYFFFFFFKASFEYYSSLRQL